MSEQGPANPVAFKPSKALARLSSRMCMFNKLLQQKKGERFGKMKDGDKLLPDD